MSVSKNSSLTLLEVIIFIGVFSIVSLIVFPFLLNTLNYYLSTRGSVDLSREARNLILVLQKEAYQSKSFDLVTDWEIMFHKFNNEHSIVFQTDKVRLNKENNTLEGRVSNIRIGSISLRGNNYGITFTNSSTCSTGLNSLSNTLYSFSGYAWSPIIGWIKFRNDSGDPVSYGVCETNTGELRGFAYNDVIGWIVFNCADLGVCASSNFKVKEENGYLKGFAWNDVIGWIFFDGSKGQVYLAKLDQNYRLTEILRLSNPQIDVQNLEFKPVGGSLQVNLSLNHPESLSKLDYTTAISLPFK